jgi:HEAT repeat protein
MSGLAMSHSPATLPVLESLYETQTSREMRRRALSGIARNDNTDAAATYLIRTAESEKDFELRKAAVLALGRVGGQRSLVALTNTIDNDSETELQKQAVIAIGRRPKDEAGAHSYPGGAKSSKDACAKTGNPGAWAIG